MYTVLYHYESQRQPDHEVVYIFWMQYGVFPLLLLYITSCRVDSDIGEPRGPKHFWNAGAPPPWEGTWLTPYKHTTLQHVLSHHTSSLYGWKKITKEVFGRVTEDRSPIWQTKHPTSRFLRQDGLYWNY